ncbi:MAG: HPP family protein [Saprospiraceae bacterium]
MNPLAPVSEIMTKNVMTLSPNDNLLNAKHIFDGNKIHHLPVVDEGQVIGILSKNDLLRITPGWYKDATANDEFFEKIKIADAMTKKIAKVQANERIDVVALILSENRFHAVPVVNESNELLGIITTFDLIRNAYKLTQEAWA